jgi:hypothetical protein
MTLRNFRAISCSYNSMYFGITGFNFDLLCTKCGIIANFLNFKLGVIESSCARLLIDEAIYVLCTCNTLRPLPTSGWLPCFDELQNIRLELMIEKIRQCTFLNLLSKAFHSRTGRRWTSAHLAYLLCIFFQPCWPSGSSFSARSNSMVRSFCW